ncbi:3-hydroxyacyl-CoA dehydrogenase, conserved site-containing protein, partial [Tanacetum coccineum]
WCMMMVMCYDDGEDGGGGSGVVEVAREGESRAKLKSLVSYSDALFSYYDVLVVHTPCYELVAKTTSKPVRGEEAHNLGLVDSVVLGDKLVDATRRWALDILERRKPWVSSLYRSDKLEPLGEAREILNFARTQACRQAPNLRHPQVCIDVIEEVIFSGPLLLNSDTCKSLLHIFFAQRGTTKAESSSDGSLELPIWLSSTVPPDT